MSLSTSRATLKSSLQTLVDNIDEDKSSSQAIDEFLDALQDWVESAQVTLPSGSVQVSGTASSQTNINPIIVDQSLS